MQQRKFDLPPDELDRLDRMRAVIRDQLPQAVWPQLDTVAGKLGTLRALLEAQRFAPDQAWELQSMGIVLGDAFVQELGMHWIGVEDQYGFDPAVQFEDTSVLIYPQTMISKRVEDGEDFDVLRLFDIVVGEVRRLVAEERAR